MFIVHEYFAISEKCLRSITKDTNIDEQVNHVKQNTNMFKLTQLLKSRIK